MTPYQLFEYLAGGGLGLAIAVLVVRLAFRIDLDKLIKFFMMEP